MILTYPTCKTLFILILMSDAALFINARARNLNGPTWCTTDDGSLGMCIDIKSCPKLNKLLEDLQSNLAPPGTVEILRKNICQTDPKLRVCCKPQPNDVSDCGNPSLTKFLVGGVNAALFAWPWMALINTKSGRGTSFTCGGVLISDRYVLTAAHCTPSNQALLGVEINFVRLGEYDLNINPDCNDGYCANKHHDASVEKVIVHPEYKKNCLKCNDIALIRLLDPIIPSSIGMYPICLPTSFEQQLKVDPANLQESNKLAVIAGWGSINKDPYNFTRPNILQEAQVPIKTTDYCTGRLENNEDKNSVFCAGNTNKGSPDTCRGDSGGPIMMKGKNGNNDSAWFVIGIVSYGPTICGQRGAQSIYTNVTHYMPWIQENMKI